MKLSIFIAFFATLAFLIDAQEEKKCPDELQAAAENVHDVCGPLLNCNKKGNGRAPGNRRRRQDEVEQESENADRAGRVQECLDKIQGESAFAELLEKCSEEGEKQLRCILREFREQCPDFKKPGEENSDSE